MAIVTRTHGDLQPVAVYDSSTYTVGSANALVSGATVQMAGPKLNFFTIDGANIDNASTESGNVALIIQTIQQLATIHMYEWTDNGSNGAICVGVYPTGAWTAATLQTAAQAVVSSVTCANGATFTTVA